MFWIHSTGTNPNPCRTALFGRSSHAGSSPSPTGTGSHSVSVSASMTLRYHDHCVSIRPVSGLRLSSGYRYFLSSFLSSTEPRFSNSGKHQRGSCTSNSSLPSMTWNPMTDVPIAPPCVRSSLALDHTSAESRTALIHSSVAGSPSTMTFGWCPSLKSRPVNRLTTTRGKA